MNERVLTLYTRRGCALCDEMAAALRRSLTDDSVILQTVDIDTNPVLKARFDRDVPLLFEREIEICRHEFDVATFEVWRRKI